MQLTEFQKLLQDTPQPVVVAFTAPWCGPCKNVYPILAYVEQRHSCQVVRIDVDKAMPLAHYYNVQGVPTVLVFHKGKPVEYALVGRQITAEAIEARLAMCEVDA